MFLAAGVSAAAAAPPYTAYSEEAADRGIEFVTDGAAPCKGVTFTDIDGDGDPDLLLSGQDTMQLGFFENNGTGHFIDRSGTTGVAHYPACVGVIAADYDNDGDLDVYVPRWQLRNLLLRNDGNWQFTEVGGDAGVDEAGPAAGCCWGDFNSDGWIDLYVSNFGTPNRLYENAGDGTFIEVGELLGVDRGTDPTYQSVFFDYDRDGDADLYVANDHGTDCDPDFIINHLFRNDGGTFVDVTLEAGVESCTDSMGIAVGDFDGNGWQDLYVTSTPGGNALMLNQGDGTFTRSELMTGTVSYRIGWGASFLDIDNNGRLDLYVCNMAGETSGANRLYLNEGLFPCNDVAPQMGVDTAVTTFTVASADIDDDGDLDMVIQNPGENVQLFVNHEGSKRAWVKFDVIGEGVSRYAIGANVRTLSNGVWRLREVIAGANFKNQDDIVLHFGLGQLGLSEKLEVIYVTWPGGAERTLTNYSIRETWRLFPGSKLGDQDLDGDRDAADFTVAATCLTGPVAGAMSPGCEGFDYEGDGDLDLRDLARFQPEFGVPVQ